MDYWDVNDDTSGGGVARAAKTRTSGGAYLARHGTNNRTGRVTGTVTRTSGARTVTDGGYLEGEYQDYTYAGQCKSAPK